MLTDNERACIDALASGYTQQQTANMLGLSVRSIEEHLRSARVVLNAKNTNHMIAIATHFKLLGPMWKSTIDAYSAAVEKE